MERRIEWTRIYKLLIVLAIVLIPNRVMADSATVNTFDELKDAMVDENVTEITVNQNIEFTEPLAFTNSKSIIGSNKDITLSAKGGSISSGKSIFDTGQSLSNDVSVKFNDITFDGKNENSFMYFHGSDTLNLEFNGTVIKNGASQSELGSSQYSATIFIGGGDKVIIENSIFENNKNGGALSAAGVELYVNDSTFRGNENRFTYFGSAIQIPSAGNDGSKNKVTKIHNSTFDDNFSNGYGGAISTASKEVSITESNFNNNRSGNGGAIFIQTSDSTYIADSSFIGNKALGSRAGAVDLINAVDIKMKNVVFKENIAKKTGGAINVLKNNSTVTTDANVSEFSRMQLENITFKDNKAESGIYFINKASNPLIYATHDEKVIGTVSLSKPAELGKNIAYNNYDISFIGQSYTVDFDTDGGSAVDSQVVSEGQVATKPADPTKEGYKLVGWQLNGENYDFTKPVTEDMTLVAVWKEKKDPIIRDITLVGGPNTLTPRVEEQLIDFNQDRISGANRYETAVEVSKTYAESETVVVASGIKYTDELTATVLANKLDTPILLTRTNDVPEVVKEELQRLKAKKIILIGGELTITPKIKDELSNKYGKANITRIGGPSRYDTAVLVGNEVRKITGNGTKTIVVDGLNFPDAIAMTSMAVKMDMPILLTPTERLHASTEKALRDWNIDKVTIGGGAGSVSEGVKNKIKEKVNAVDRIAGQNRYETATLVSELIYPNPNHAVIASGEIYPDAIVAAPYAAKYGYPLLLSRANDVPTVVMNYLNK